MPFEPSHHEPQGSVSPAALAMEDRYSARCRDLAATAGILNATHGHLVDVAIACLAEQDHVGPGLHTFAHFLAWRTGVSTTTARSVERVARRAHELPLLHAALCAGEISLEQAAVVARYVPAAFDRSATELAKVATVTQLKAVLPAYRDPVEPRQSRGNVSITDTDDETSRISGELDTTQGALVRKALDAMREDLWRQRKADAKAAALASGTPEVSVEVPTGADALAAMAETALQAHEAAHPGSHRYLISYHLQATPDGRFLLVDDRGIAVDDAERRRILCDHRFERVLHDAQGTPLSVGRTTRHIGRKLRRAILHRHHGACAVPGCATGHGLEIHHILHWEDGGATDTANLIPLCHRHHKAHHLGQLHIVGNADLPASQPGSLHIGPPDHPLERCGRPVPVPPPRPTADLLDHLRHELTDRLDVVPPPSATTPRGDRLDRRNFHLQPAPPPPAGRQSPDGPPDAHAPPAA